jgi:hemoglobin-like flavoprotein
VTPEHEALVRSSWSIVREKRDALAVTFYARLFEIAPYTEQMFAGVQDMALQRKKFTDMLESMVTALEHPERLVGDVAALGRRHKDYGVVAKDYPLVGDALLYALEQNMGGQMDGETRAAWREAYLLLAGLMQRGARASQPQA